MNGFDRDQAADFAGDRLDTAALDTELNSCNPSRSLIVLDKQAGFARPTYRAFYIASWHNLTSDIDLEVLFDMLYKWNIS
jgi:hypothetical protein